MSSLFLKQGIKPLLPAILAVFMFACSTLPGAVVQPAKSPNDSNEYRYITLDNDLQVLLISDPDTKKAPPG